MKNKSPTGRDDGPMLRAQYHFRSSERGLLAWDVRRLVALSAKLPTKMVALREIAELDETYWYSQAGAPPTCRSVVEHCRLIAEADLAYPIIVDLEGRVMDGMHRVCKALLQGAGEVLAVQFSETPAPDFVGREPESLPYDDA